MNQLNDPTETPTLHPALVPPEGWQQTPTGMRSLDGRSIDGLTVGCDPTGEWFVVARADGSDAANHRILTDNLAVQLEVALRTARIDVSQGDLGALANGLKESVMGATEMARTDFYGSLVGGKLYELLEGKGIGPRHPWNVASVMRVGPISRAMLLEDWLVAAELHWIAAEPGAGKTWLGLWLAWRVIREGGIVVWTDEELGVDTVAERLLALGATPDLIESNLVYLPYPGWQAERGDVNAWIDLVRASRPSLVVIDTATDALAEAGVDENSGAEVTKWVKAYCEPPRRIGAAVLVLDHVPKSDRGARSGYAVGSRAKKAKAKLQFSLSKREDFTADTTGIVRVILDKNSFGLPIEPTRSFRVGGEGGRFVIEPASPAEAADADGAFDESPEERRERVRTEQREKAVVAIQEAGRINTTELRKAVGGNAQALTASVKALVEDDDFPVRVDPEARGTVYEWTAD